MIFHLNRLNMKVKTLYSTLCMKFLPWNRNVINLMKFLTLATPIILTTFGAASEGNFIKMRACSFNHTGKFSQGETPSLTSAFVVQYPPDESYLVDQFYNGESLCNLHLNQHGWLLCVHGRALKDKMAQYGKGLRTEESSDSLSQSEKTLWM